MDRCSKRIKKKRAIPSYFRKKNSSQFLEAAQYKHQIKKLKKVNKELACSIQELKCRAADQDRTLAECTRESTQMMFVKMKVKEIVETVQKFVIDLGKVYDVIDGKSFDLLKNCSAQHQENRLRIRNPSISTIEESASMSTIEPDLSKEESQSDATSRPFQADDSRTEIYNVPFCLFSEQKLEDASNKSVRAVTRSSKSIERTGSLPRDQTSPSTPETPVFLPIFPSIKSQNLIAISKLKPAVSPALNESQKSSDAEPQFTTSPSAIKNTAKLIISKIPVKKLALCKNNSVHLNVPSNNLNQRKSFVVEEPQVSVPISDRRGTFVLDKLVDNAKSDENPDRRGTFVLNAFADNAKSEAISDRRGTFVLNTIVDNKPDAIFDRRTTYFIPTQSKELTNSPKLLETHNPVQNVAPNQTILLCEDMELTEIIPNQNQIQQFVLTLPPCFEKPETNESDLSEEMPSTMHQASCSTTVAEKCPVSNINSSKVFEINATQTTVKDAEIHNTMDVRNNSDKPSTSNVISKAKVMVKGLQSNREEKSADLQQQKSNAKNLEKMCIKETKAKVMVKGLQSNGEEKPADLQQQKSYAKDLEKVCIKETKAKVMAKGLQSNGEEKPADLQQQKSIANGLENMCNKGKITTIKCSAKELPSPISHSVKTDLSIQHKILQSVSSENAVSEKKKCPVNDLHVERNSRKKSNVLKDSISNNQQILEKMPVPEKTDSPKTNRRSSRKKKSCFDNFFSDSNESDVVSDEDFIPKKRFSLKPGRKIINPNNKKVFIFKKKSIKNNSGEDAPISSCSDKSPEEKIKDDAEKDVFNFSTSSEDDKSPLKKCKKKKSVLSKNKKLSLKNRQSNVDDKILSKRKSKKSLKPEVNQAEIPLTAFPRKSILCFNKDEALLSNRKSVRFTLVDAPKFKNFDLSQESNTTPVKQNCKDTQDAEKEPSLTSRVSLVKRLSCRDDNSLKATGDVIEEESPIIKSKKRQVCILNLDSSESDCSPTKKMSLVSNETTPKSETYTDFNCCSQKQNKNGKDRNEHSPSIDNANLSGISEEKTADAEKDKKSFGILSELPFNQDVKVKTSSDKYKGKRPFSGVSERRSSKKESIVDDLFLDLDDAASKIEDKQKKVSLNFVEDKSVKVISKSIETDCDKSNAVKTKTPKQKNDATSKASKKRKTVFKNKENIPNDTEFLKLDTLTSDDNLGMFSGYKDSTEKPVKQKRSRKKKESASSLHQKDSKIDDLISENPIESSDAVVGRSRRSRPVISFKEPSLHTKMRRQ